MRRREFLTTAAAWPAVPTQAQTKPNIVLLLTDDQRFDTIRALGNRDVITPNLDRLVQQGTAFTKACIMGGTIPAVCAPSRAMLWSGQSLHHAHAALVAHTVRPYETSAELLRKAGYRTFGTGKWHNGEKAYARSFGSGGPVMFGGMSNHLKVPVADYDPSGDFPKDRRRTGEKFSSELFTDAAVDFIQNQKPGQPFFVYIGYTSPHDPRMAPKKFTDMYDPAKLAAPPNFLPQHPFDNGELKVRDETLAAFPRTEQIAKEHLAAYYAMISEVDAQIGRVLDSLEKTGLAKNTFVIFAADNGLAVGQHGLLGKQNLYDHSIRIPMVVSGPGLPRGKKNDSLVYLMDVAPTICELGGIAPPAGVEGESLLPLVKAGKRGSRDSVYLAYRNFQRGIRTDRWKLILYNVAGKETVQLFDLENDPWEKRNLATEQGTRVRELRQQLRAWMKRVDDPLDLEKPGWGQSG